MPCFNFFLTMHQLQWVHYLHTETQQRCKVLWMPFLIVSTYPPAIHYFSTCLSNTGKLLFLLLNGSSFPRTNYLQRDNLRNPRYCFSKSNAHITLLTQCSLTVRDRHRSAHTEYSDPMDFVIWIFHDFNSEDLKVLISLDEIVQSCCKSHFTDG